ncbi:conjugal transfer protein TraF [Halovibrio salipaludis]|nr:conjugal transfer protein TraF [Halovibrio salipaludis]
MSTHTSRARTRLAMAVALTTAAASTQAAPPQFNDARAFGMGGTGVAAARPSGAALFNPSLLAADHSGWNDGFSTTLPSVNARYAENEDVVDGVDRIQDTIEELEVAITAATNNPTPGSVQEVKSGADKLGGQLRDINNEFVRGDAGLGTLFAIPSPTLSVGVHVNAQVRATVESRIDGEDLTALDNVASLDDNASEQEVRDALDPIYDQSSGELNPKSDGRVLASAVGEIGLTLARSFELQGQAVNFGVTPKLVQMRTFDYAQGVDDFDEDEFDASEYETKDTHINVDIGASTDLGSNDQWRVGASVRNLIPQTLKAVEDNGSTVQGRYDREEMKLDPLVTVGVAHTSGWHTLTADLDLTKNEGIGPAADQQWLAVGGEFNVYDWINVRAGARQNLASDTGDNGIEEETQYTAGFALSPWALRIEAGALFSSEEVGGAVELGMSF